MYYFSDKKALHKHAAELAELLNPPGGGFKHP